MMQEALNRWWAPMLQFFGPPDKESAHSEILMRWKVKILSNDDTRQQWLDMYVPKIWELDLTIPDEKLRKNEETGKWEYTEPDWDEFIKVINGDGPCNEERLNVRKTAEKRGEWVRKAILGKSEYKEYVTPLA